MTSIGKNEFGRSDVDLSIIFVNWNSSNYLRQCIQSLYAHTAGVEFEIIVVDNASPAEDVDLLGQEFSQITLIKSRVNLGFAGANNEGFRNSSGRYLLFLNPDTKLVGPAIKRMLHEVKSLADAGVVGCKLLNGDLTIQTSCVQAFPTILNQVLDAEVLRKRWRDHRLWGMQPLYARGSGATRAEVISGSCMMVRREVFEQVGMFSEEYFMYAEDLDLCYKTARAGYSNYCLSDTSVVHYGGGSSTPSIATVVKWHSMLQYFVKHRGAGYCLLFRFAMSIAAVCRLSLLAVASVFGARREDSDDRYTSSMKWRAILRTLVTHSGTARMQV